MMMRQLRDFLCHQCSKTTERYIDATESEVRCPHCGGVAIRIIGMPRVALDGTDPDFPGAYQKWATVREENRRIKGKRSYQKS
jgi:DNA-directed RNA polymerase subunit RPC12/RpoP